MTEKRDQVPSGGAVEPPCTSPRMRARLVPYALGRAEGEPEEEFETHLITCEACFADLKAIDRTQALIREFLETEGPEVQAARRKVGRRRQRRRLGLAALLLAAAGAGFAAGMLV